MSDIFNNDGILQTTFSKKPERSQENKHTTKITCTINLQYYSGCDVIHVVQEESRRYYTTLGNIFCQLDLSADHPVHLPSCCSIEEEVTELLVHFAMYTHTQKH